MQRSLNKKLRVFKCDNGSEFFRLKDFFQQEGIRFDTSTQYTPQRNGIVERWNRTLQERMTAMLMVSKLNIVFWPFAAKTYTYCHHRTGSRVTNGLTPYELMFGRKPDVSHMSVWSKGVCGC